WARSRDRHRGSQRSRLCDGAEPWDSDSGGNGLTMGLTMTEKILARAAHQERVTPGEIVEIDVDLVMTNDITAPISIAEFKKTGLDTVFDPNKVVFVPDHFVPAKDIKAA